MKRQKMEDKTFWWIFAAALILPTVIGLLLRQIPAVKVYTMVDTGYRIVDVLEVPADHEKEFYILSRGKDLTVVERYTSGKGEDTYRAAFYCSPSVVHVGVTPNVLGKEMSEEWLLVRRDFEGRPEGEYLLGYYQDSRLSFHYTEDAYGPIQIVLCTSEYGRAIDSSDEFMKLIEDHS